VISSPVDSAILGASSLVLKFIPPMNKSTASLVRLYTGSANSVNGILVLKESSRWLSNTLLYSTVEGTLLFGWIKYLRYIVAMHKASPNCVSRN
jgi:hypothetical protein